MRILQISKYSPVPQDTGGKIRVLGLAGALSEFAEVDLLCFNHNEQNTGMLINNNIYNNVTNLCSINKFFGLSLPIIKNVILSNIPIRSSPYVTNDLIIKLEDMLEHHDYDVIQVEELPMMAVMLRYFRNLKTPVVYSSHNVESLLSYTMFKNGSILKRVLSGIERKRTEHEEDKCNRYSQKIICVSEHDKVKMMDLTSYDTQKYLVIPNCPSSEIKLHKPVASVEIIFPACFGWQPNIDAAHWFIKDILPQLRSLLPSVMVRFVGSHMRNNLEQVLLESGCLVNKDVPTMNSYYISARAMFIPLRIGSGTRIKILEAWQAGIPVISTTIGAEGLIEKDNGTEILIQDDAKSFAQAIHKVLTDDELYQSLRNAGIKRSITYKWNNYSDTLKDTYKQVLSNQ